jgi:phage terminase large subunit
MDDPRLIFEARAAALDRLRADPRALAAARQHYRQHPGDFINDWGVTVDPRSIAKGKAALVPFTLWPKQCDLIDWAIDRWRRGEPGVVVKSRDVGASWVTMALLATLAIFERNFAGGVASATEVKLDRSGDPDTLFYKLREFLKHLPPEFNGGYSEDKSAYLRITFPETGSSITGEAGDAAGRGGRKSLYVVDESAHFERPQLIDANLSANTDCAIHMSSVNGAANTFFEKAHNPAIPRFDITWRDDPRKSPEWYAEKSRTLDPIIVAQEIDCNFYASTTGQLIPVAHINSAIGAAEKLGLGPPSGAKRAALDPADEGKDKNALAVRHGSTLIDLESWPGKGSNIYKSTVRFFGVCDRHGVRTAHFDADGLGAGVRGDAASINEKRQEAGAPEIDVTSYRGSGGVFDPDGSLLEGVTNRDAFLNLKAMSWWALKLRFEYTHRAVEAAERGEPIEFDPDDVISIDLALPELNALVSELSQPVYSYTSAGKRQIDKAPEGVASPNLADAVCILFSPFTVGGYFSGVRTVATGPSERPAPGMPARLDRVFASLVIADDVAAVVYCAANGPDDGTRGVGLWVLDYDVCVLAEGADAWLIGLDDHLAGVRDATPPAAWFAVLHGTYVDDFDEGWASALSQLGVTVNVVGDDLPPLAERYNKSKPYTTRGLVALGPVAARKEVAFKGSKRNFLREVVTTSAPPESSALALAFATAVLLTYHGRTHIPTPTLTPEQFPPLPPPPPAPSALRMTATGVWVPVLPGEQPPGRPPGTGAMLTPGAHVIDGKPVVVPRVDGQDLTFVPLTRGRHEVDGKLFLNFPKPGSQIEVEDLWMYR